VYFRSAAIAEQRQIANAKATVNRPVVVGGLEMKGTSRF